MADKTTNDQKHTGRPITRREGERDVSTEQGGATPDQTRPIDKSTRGSAGAPNQADSRQSNEPRVTQADRKVLEAAESTPAVTPWTAGDENEPE